MKAQKLALISLTSGDRSVGIVLSRTKATELVGWLFCFLHIAQYVRTFSSGATAPCASGTPSLFPKSSFFWDVFVSHTPNLEDQELHFVWPPPIELSRMDSQQEDYAPASRALLVTRDYELHLHDIEIVRFVTASHNTDITQFMVTVIRYFRISCI
jgi:hypothetical protein